MSLSRYASLPAVADLECAVSDLGAFPATGGSTRALVHAADISQMCVAPI